MFAAALASIAASAAESYSVAVLGDTHFDAEPESVYHANHDETQKNATSHHHEFARNGEMWRERMPALLAASGAIARERPTRFILQLGDLVQGDCDDAPTHRQMLEDAVHAIRAHYPALLPFITVPGNHDVRGKDARQAYFEWAAPFLSGELGRTATFPVVSFEIDGDIWVLCDFEASDLNRIADEIDAHPAARHVFLVTHGPFTAPDSKNWHWRLGGRPADEQGRKRLYETLSRRRAIVLSGHTHTTAFYRHENEFGGFTEMTVNSVWASPNSATANPPHDNPGQYGSFSRGRIQEDRRGAYDRDHAEFHAGLKEYFFSNAAGHYRLDVSDDGVTCAFFPGDAREPARLFRLF